MICSTGYCLGLQMSLHSLSLRIPLLLPLDMAEGGVGGESRHGRLWRHLLGDTGRVTSKK